MNTIILTSYLDFYEKDEQGNKIAHNFGNDNEIFDCLKSNIKKYDNFVFVANGMEGEKAEAYFKLACNSFELTLPFNNYEFLCPSTKNRAKEMIEKADFIFLCGGHLPTQNKFFNDIGLRELLKNTNALIVGGSAGSMNCADVVYCPPELEEEVLDDKFNRYLKGLGLTNINIMPHFEEYQKMVICGKRYIDDIVVPDSHKIDIIALNNGSYIVIKDNQTTIYGESYLIRKGKITQINENQNTKHVLWYYFGQFKNKETENLFSKKKRLHLIAAICFTISVFCSLMGLVNSTNGVQLGLSCFTLALCAGNTIAQFILLFKKR